MDEEKSTLSTSFLDVLSCGLGAAILQFLVFSVLPHSGMARSGGPKDVVSGHARELRELGVLVEEKERVDSLNAAVVLSFPVSDAENKGLTLPMLRDAIAIKNVSPASRLARGKKGFDLSAVDMFEVKSTAGHPNILVVRIDIAGGQVKGRVIEITVRHESIPITGSCRMLVGNRELAAKSMNEAKQLTSRSSLDFTKNTIKPD